LGPEAFHVAVRGARFVTNAEDHLAKAKEADEQAERTLSPIAKRAWQVIAENYRKLAKTSGTDQSVR